MRAWLADRLLQASCALYVASVWCKDRALALLIARARSRSDTTQPEEATVIILLGALVAIIGIGCLGLMVVALLNGGAR